MRKKTHTDIEIALTVV